VIRVSQNRILLNPADGKRLGLVFEHIAGVAPLGECTWTCAAAMARLRGERSS
jgi:hypothetical protein